MCSYIYFLCPILILNFHFSCSHVWCHIQGYTVGIQYIFSSIGTQLNNKCEEKKLGSFPLICVILGNGTFLIETGSVKLHDGRKNLIFKEKKGHMSFMLLFHTSLNPILTLRVVFSVVDKLAHSISYYMKRGSGCF